MATQGKCWPGIGNRTPLIARRRCATLVRWGRGAAEVQRLFRRVRAILLTPQTEWPVIVHERAEVAKLSGGYVAILAAIPPLAYFVGRTLVGGYVSFPSGLIAAAAAYVLTFAAVYALALVIDALAPRFHGHRDFANALSLSAYSCTPIWLAGIFLLVPGLSFLTLLGLYGAYLLAVGVAPLMRAPRDQVLLYAAAVAICGGVLALIVVGLPSMLPGVH